MKTKAVQLKNGCEQWSNLLQQLADEESNGGSRCRRRHRPKRSEVNRVILRIKLRSDAGHDVVGGAADEACSAERKRIVQIQSSWAS